MSSEIEGDGTRFGAAPGTTPDPAAWLDAGAAAFRDAGRRVSDWSEAAARYFRQRRREDIAADLAALARARPGQTLAVAAMLGALVGGALYGFGRR